MKDIFTDSLIQAIITKKKGDRVQLVGFGSFSKSVDGTPVRAKVSIGLERRTIKNSDEQWERKRPGRTKYSNIVLKRIAEKLKDINPKLAKKFAEEKQGFTREEQDEIAIASYKRAFTPAKKVVKFKAGSELADSVKSVSPEGGKTIGAGQVIDIIESPVKDIDELVNLTEKDVNEVVDIKSSVEPVEQAAEDAADAVEE